MNLIHIISIVSTLLVTGAMIYFAIRYRRRGPDDETSTVAHNTTIEVVWTVIPTVVMMILFVLGLVQFNKARSVPDDAMRIDVVGAQWRWDYFYPAKADPSVQVKTDLLYLEEHRPTKLVMRSTDVLHSYFVPEFRVKEDVVSSTFKTYLSFRPHISAKQKAMGPKDRVQGKDAKDPARDPCIDLQKSGVKECAAYRVYCTEFCGRAHSGMLSWAIVLPREEFSKQLAVFEKEATNVSAERGAKIYQVNCIACHSLDGSRRVGPTFKGLYGQARELEDGSSVSADDAYITSSITEPQKQVVKGYPAQGMPAQNLSDAEIRSMIQYIKSIK